MKMITFISVLIFSLSGYSKSNNAKNPSEVPVSRKPAAITEALKERIVEAFRTGKKVSGKGWDSCRKNLQSELKNLKEMSATCAHFKNQSFVSCDMQARIDDSVNTLYFISATLSDFESDLKMEVYSCGYIND